MKILGFFVIMLLMLCFLPNIAGINEQLNLDYLLSDNSINYKTSSPPTELPSWMWANCGGGLSVDDGLGICVDNVGNTYITGGFVEEAFFGGIILQGDGDFEIYVAKLDENGDWIDFAVASGTNAEAGINICVDDNRDVYITGIIVSTDARFGPFTNLPIEGESDIFVAKLNEDLDWQWVTTGGSVNLDWVNGICVDDQGCCYITGFIGENATFGSHHVSPLGMDDIFVSKINATGDWEWVVTAGGKSYDWSYDICIDGVNNDSLFITGVFDQDALFGHIQLGTVYQDIFIAKLDVNGSWIWANKAGGVETDVGKGICVDSSGRIYVTGSFRDIADFDSHSVTSTGETDIFIAIADQNGAWYNVVNFLCPGADFGNDIAVDDENIYFIGSFKYDDLTFFNLPTLINMGSSDMYVACIAKNFKPKWLRHIGTINEDVGNGIAVRENRIYTVGGFGDTITIQDFIIGSETLVNQGQVDVFVGCIYIVEFQSTCGFYTPQRGVIYIGGEMFWQSPLQRAFIIGKIDLEVDVEGFEPGLIDYVEIHVDGKKVQELMDPPYIWHWGFKSDFPGFHELMARAVTIYGDIMDSEAVKILKIM